MSRIARLIRAIPVRTATDSWGFIVDLIAPARGSMRNELERAGNTAAMLITEEHTSDSPIVLSGCGPQVRIYTLHGDVAVDGGTANERTLTLTLSSGWQLALPASRGDFALAVAAAEDLAHVTIYDSRAGEPPPDAFSNNREARIQVDLEPLER